MSLRRRIKRRKRTKKRRKIRKRRKSKKKVRKGSTEPKEGETGWGKASIG